MFILFAASAFRKLSSVYVFSYFEGRIWDLIVSVPDHCLSFYFESGNHVSYTDHTQLTIVFFTDIINVSLRLGHDFSTLILFSQRPSGFIA